MSLSALIHHQLDVRARAPAVTHRPRPGPHRHGHAHFWQRALSRRRVIQTAAGAGVLALGSSLSVPRLARAAQMEEAMPKPIPGGLDVGGGNIIHVFLPEPGAEPSTITDFRGFVGINHVQGEGTVTTGGGGGGVSTPTAAGDRLLIDADMRFLKGLYIGEDGEEHVGTFAFV
ncbi:MAG: hypothetical protein ACRDJC_19400 [Thermomicrobiales bacterium]